MGIYLLQYYWDNKIYDKNKMCELVKQGIISKEDFFNITRLRYDVIKKRNKKQDVTFNQ